MYISNDSAQASQEDSRVFNRYYSGLKNPKICAPTHIMEKANTRMHVCLDS